MWSGLVQLPTKSRQAAKAPARLESCPPAPFGHEAGFMDRLLDRLIDWLGEGFERRRHANADSNDSQPPAGVTPLPVVRLEFADAVADIPTRAADELAHRIHNARSLRELWHLRADVFNAVSCHCDQAEARTRLAQLNRHFPARAPKSGFGGFDVIEPGRSKS
ncbi:hypothetical protein [Piscinibacter terrae]|uniref:Uncharacterized protein n=1 Tax=Piscinibacter terrae TaxID=2496871 RepID=A0A3N7HQ18_9BURK|nr:hypothetical protein [Albitalea terrae]RQP23793.1 hypothetical protein DZC73_16875 [Albitalea terrae]